MRISVLCSNDHHPIVPRLRNWCATMQREHAVELVTKRDDLSGGDLLFLVSCVEVIPKAVRSRYANTLVLHASALPEGRGWSPHVWQIIEGRLDLTVTLLEAVDAVDAGPIWRQECIRFEGHELWDEINEALFDAEIRLMSWAVVNVPGGTPTPQAASPATYYRRRTPEDSRLDPDASIASQFDVLRICDPERFPAFFELRGRKYTLTIRKVT